MRGVIAWFAENTVAANILMVVIVAGGLLAIPRVQREIFPEISADSILVTVPYLGATPEEVEEAICVRIEEAIQDLEGIDRLISTASEAVCTVVVEALDGYDIRTLLEEVRSRVFAIDTFPAEAEEPVIREVTLRRQVLNVAISGDTSEATLKRLGEQVRDELSAIPGVTMIELASVRPYEISIEVSERKLRRHNLTFDEVAQAVRNESLDLPGGSIETPGGEILLRTEGQAYTGKQFENLVLLRRPDGTRVHVGDVATVVDGFAETDQRARFNGRPAVLVQVFRVGQQSVLEVADLVHEYVERAQARVPEGIELTIWQDNSAFFRSRLELLTRNGLTGLLLVLLLLTFFLKVRLAFWVTLGIPISFLGAIWLMPVLDVSLNMLSLFAFILVLGIVVDDAIIVGENIHRQHREGRQELEGAVRGAQEVTAPVVFAVLTSVVAFSPLLFVPGVSGRIWRVIPLIVIPALIFSLVESLLILPAHLSHMRENDDEPRTRMGRVWSGFQAFFSRGLERTANGFYRPGLEIALRWRYLAVAVGIAILLITVGLVAGGWVPIVFLPSVEADFVIAMVTMPLGTPSETTEEVVRGLERSAMQLAREIDLRRGPGEPSIIRHMLTSIGEQPFRAQERQRAGVVGVDFTGAHLGEVNIELAPAEERTVSSEEIALRWRELTGPIPGAVEVTYISSLFRAGEAINIRLSGPRMEELLAASEQLKDELRRIPGVFDVADTYRAGKEELRLSIRPEAQYLNLSLADLARQVRQGFYGEEAQRVQRGRDDVRVMVRYPRSERRSLNDIENMWIRTAGGDGVPFSTVAIIERGRGPASIQRIDRRRAVSVTADVDPARANAAAITNFLMQERLPQITARFPGIRYELAGEQEERRESTEGLIQNFQLALLGIYALLAIPFRSYVQPLIVMSAVPFGLVGATWAHLLLGLELSLLSMSGMVALSGVVVNDSLILVDFVNRRRREGAPLFRAVRSAGVVRFRPVLLTSLTTFAGLTPLLLERSLQAQFLIPMAVSLGFGVLFGTVITLALVPCLYMILEDVRRGVVERIVGAVQGNRRPEPPPRSRRDD